jgi:hypothetical protein
LNSFIRDRQSSDFVGDFKEFRVIWGGGVGIIEYTLGRIQLLVV